MSDVLRKESPLSVFVSLQDWEVRATYIAYRRQYGSREKALQMMA
jgi:hypothetical protein